MTSAQRRRRRRRTDSPKREPGHGGDRPRPPASARRRPATTATRVRRRRGPSRRAGPDRPAVRFDEGARRLGVHLVQRPGRAARWPPPADRRRTSPPARGRTTGAAACVGGWLSAASASGSHSISRSRGVWPLRISQFSTVSPGDAAIARRSRLQLPPREPQRRAPCRSTDSRSRHDSASQSSTPASRCNGGGSAGHASRDAPPGAIDHRHRELRLQRGRGRAAPMSPRNANVSV